MSNETQNIINLRKTANSIGIILSNPTKDMYGKFECSVENIKTGSVNVVMNCQSKVEAAKQALSIEVDENNIHLMLQNFHMKNSLQLENA